jgi:DNA-binding CsgD family transcriptional regulator
VGGEAGIFDGLWGHGVMQIRCIGVVLYKGNLWLYAPSMISMTSYDEVVSEIYEAALVPARWDLALTKMINEFAPREWEVALLLWERHTPAAGRFLGTTGLDRLVHDVYISNFAGSNEWSKSSRRIRVGETVHSDRLVSRARFRTTPLYRELLHLWDMDSAIISMLDRHGPDQLGLVMPGSSQFSYGGLLEALALLQPHLQRAARISRRIGEADLRVATAKTLLDNSPYAVFALGPDLEVLLANTRAQLVLSNSSNNLFLKGHLLCLADRAAHARLYAMSSGGRGEGCAASFSLHDDLGREHFYTAIAVQPKSSAQFDDSVGGATLMLVGRQHLGMSNDLTGQIEQSFGLTAAEARLAGHLVQGAGFEGYMEERGVSMHAARFVLKSIFNKMGARSQAELITMLHEAPLGWQNTTAA